MKAEEIREIVRMTIDELLNANVLSLNVAYPKIKGIVESELISFFNGNKNQRMSRILNQLYDDEYIDVIFLYYRDGKTLEWIAEYMDKDVSTITRNRKRLITEIYNLLSEV